MSLSSNDSTPGRIPFLTQDAGSSSFIASTALSGLDQALWVVQGVDLVIKAGDSPSHWFVEFGYGVGQRFYYYSQSIGEGLGIYFAWRGSIALSPSVAFFVNAHEDGGLVDDWSWSAWGHVVTF
jgi:hypothetical protein